MINFGESTSLKYPNMRYFKKYIERIPSNLTRVFEDPNTHLFFFNGWCPHFFVNGRRKKSYWGNGDIIVMEYYLMISKYIPGLLQLIYNYASTLDVYNTDSVVKEIYFSYPNFHFMWLEGGMSRHDTSCDFVGSSLLKYFQIVVKIEL